MAFVGSPAFSWLCLRSSAGRSSGVSVFSFVCRVVLVSVEAENSWRLVGGSAVVVLLLNTRYGSITCKLAKFIIADRQPIKGIYAMTYPNFASDLLTNQPVVSSD